MPRRRFRDTLYKRHEDKKILKEALEAVKKYPSTKFKGNQFWMDLERRTHFLGNQRTWSSMRERFLKRLLHRLPEYGISKDDAKILLEHSNMDPNKIQKMLLPYERRRDIARDYNLFVISPQEYNKSFHSNSTWYILDCHVESGILHTDEKIWVLFNFE